MFRKGISSKHHHDEDQPGVLAGWYKKALRWSLNHKAITFLAAVIILVASVFLVPAIGVSFLPEEEQKYVMLTYSPAPGELLEEVADTALKAEELILNEPDIQSVQYSVGGGNPLNPAATKSALFYVLYDPDVKNFSEVKTELLENVQQAAAGKGQWGSMEDRKSTRLNSS